ncbi:MAG: hypothetical protein GXO50_07370 [Chlorobi bacterium]|nr:hypothetical protein [Chlorobiota bacterium]
MKRTVILLFAFLLSAGIVSAQTGGLSASKLGTYCTETVPAGAIEFEPAFNLSSSVSFFDSNGDVRDLFMSEDSTQYFSSLGLRFTYGLFENFEAGISLPFDVSTLSAGVKYKLPLDIKPEFALMAGYNGIYGNNIYVKRDEVSESTSSVAFGIISTYEISDKLSADFNAQYQKHLNKTVAGHDRGYYVNTDIGYYLFENINFIAGFYYLFRDHENPELDSYLFTFNPGIAVERAERFILVLNAPFDLFGKNEYKTKGFGLALTILLN